MRKLVLSAAVLAATMIGGAGAAQAGTWCGMYGKVFYTYGTPGYCVAYVQNQTSGIPTVVHGFYSSSPIVCDLAAEAQGNGQTVYVSGYTAAATCSAASWSSYGDYSYASSTSITMMQNY